MLFNKKQGKNLVLKGLSEWLQKKITRCQNARIESTPLHRLRPAETANNTLSNIHEKT